MNGRRIFAMILAAGQSRRMGMPKLFLQYGEGNILEAVLDGVMESSVDGLVVVANKSIQEFLAGQLPEECEVAVNDDPKSEMLTSVQIGFRQVEQSFEPGDEDGLLVLLGDQPEVSAGTITTVAEAYRLPRNPPGILIATYRGRPGHPTVFSVGMLREVMDWTADRRLNELAGLHPDRVRACAITSAPWPIDVNTPDDYERLTDESRGRGISGSGL